MIRIYDWKENINKDELNNVKNALERGELIIFPTETVYGIGANALDREATNKIYEAKGRPSDNPLIVHVSDYDMLYKYTKDVSDIENKLIKAFMPGPFTLILKKSEIIPYEVTANLDTVAIRMPNNNIAKMIINNFKKPIAAPSANISGKPSGTKVADIKDELGEKVYAIIDGGNTQIGLESTVVKVIDGIPTILRPGAVTAEDIKNIIGNVKIDEHVLNKSLENEIFESPGMKHRHYAPKTKCLLIDIDDEHKKINVINKFVREDVCVIGFNKNRDKIKECKYIGMGDNLDEVSKNLFTLLRKADSLNCSLIIIEGVKSEGLGLAIMNRLIRACDYNVIRE